jgi:hypothetical protein
MEDISEFVGLTITLRPVFAKTVLLTPAAWGCFAREAITRNWKKKKDVFVNPVNFSENFGLKEITSVRKEKNQNS